VQYFHPLNFIRFILAIGVVLFHYGKNYYPFNQGILNDIIVNSAFRVSFFFFISGFVMCLVYAPLSATLTVREFYKKRLTRILPMYWLAFIVSILLILFVLNASPKGLVIITHFLGLQSLYPGYVLDLNFTAWSISVELVFYSVFPFLLRWILKFPAGKLMSVAFILWLLQTAQHIIFVDLIWDGSKWREEFISTFPLWHIVTFIGGMATARMIALDSFPASFRRYALAVFMVCLVLFGYVILVPNPVLKYIHNGLLLPLFALTVLSLYYDRSFLHRFLSAKSVNSLGDLSYAIFIFQYPLWIVCSAIAGNDRISTSGFFIGYLMVLLIFSYAVNRFVEKPLLLYFRRGSKITRIKSQ
jgi:peptidoglycan/LPS O-acetylase OafA/YrhL